jgi:hypothetical protein
MSLIAYRRIIARLDSHGYTGRVTGTHAQYQCPGHEDRTPSLSIDDRPDSIVVHCHGPCSDNTLRVLEPIGLTFGDLFDEPARGKGWQPPTLQKLGARMNGDGRLELGGVRYLLGGDPKTLAVKGAKRDLWPAPSTVAGPVLYVVEGEPDAVTATQIGLPVVAIPGAGKFDSSWPARIAEGRKRVVVIPDADEAGRKAAQKVAAAVAALGTDVRVLDLTPERDDGHDLSDWMGADASAADWADAKRCIERAVEHVEPFAEQGCANAPAAYGCWRTSAPPSLALQRRLRPRQARATLAHLAHPLRSSASSTSSTCSRARRRRCRGWWPSRCS